MPRATSTKVGEAACSHPGATPGCERGVTCCRGHPRAAVPAVARFYAGPVGDGADACAFVGPAAHVGRGGGRPSRRGHAGRARRRLSPAAGRRGARRRVHSHHPTSTLSRLRLALAHSPRSPSGDERSTRPLGRRRPLWWAMHRGRGGMQYALREGVQSARGRPSSITLLHECECFLQASGSCSRGTATRQAGRTGPLPAARCLACSHSVSRAGP